MKNLTPDKFQEGMRIHCMINDVIITDAKLHYEEYYRQGRWFICQNKIAASNWNRRVKNKLNYSYVWNIEDGSERNYILSFIAYLIEAPTLKDKLQILKKYL